MPHMRSAPRLLLTGFEPFGGESVNPSMQAVLALAAAPPRGIVLHTAILPVSHRRTPPALRAAVARHRPDVVLATGQAGGRAEVSVERTGTNLNDFAVPDNDGARPAGVKVVADGPAAYVATLPLAAVLAALRAACVPAGLSDNAGTHLCNHTLYLLCHLAATAYPGMRCGFLHLPFLPEQAARHPGQPGMTIATLVTALTAAIGAIAADQTVRAAPPGPP